MTCGGTCGGGCSPSEALSGSFSDGSGDRNYDMNEKCWWLIERSAAEGEIRVSFSSFHTEKHYDFVYIYECDTAACEPGRRKEKAQLSGSSYDVSLSSDEYSSSTGFLKVTFTSDSLDTYSGFTGTWSIISARGAKGCANCPAGKFSAEGVSVGLSVRAPALRSHARTTLVCIPFSAAPPPRFS